MAGRKTSRIEALSDGVFAVALTLLVLDIKAPAAEIVHSNAELCAAFQPLLPRLLIYFLSFMTLGIFWMGHTTQFHYIAKGDRNLHWISLLFLSIICLLPFTTSFLSEFIHFRFAIFLYWLNILLCGLVLLFHWHYALRKGLVDAPADLKKAMTIAMNRRVIIAQILYAIGAALCFFNNYVSITFIIIVQLNYALSLVTRRFRL